VANQLYRLAMSLVDEDGVRANVAQYAQIPEAVTGTQLSGILGDWATAVSNLSEGAVLRTEASLVVEPSVFTLPATPSGTQEVSDTAGFQYDLATSPMTWSSSIPAFLIAAESGSNVDITNAAVIAYNLILTTAILTTGHFCSPDGIALSTRRATFLGVRKHRRQLHAKSYKLG
jgi:hypothetical protein